MILETCTDGIKNQDELGTDCGASGDCGACGIEYIFRSFYSFEINIKSINKNGRV